MLPKVCDLHKALLLCCLQVRLAVPLPVHFSRRGSTVGLQSGYCVRRPADSAELPPSRQCASLLCWAIMASSCLCIHINPMHVLSMVRLLHLTYPGFAALQVWWAYRRLPLWHCWRRYLGARLVTPPKDKFLRPDGHYLFAGGAA